MIFYVKMFCCPTWLQSPTIFVPFIDNACCFFGNGFLEGMLQPHIHAAGGSVTDGGIAFFMQGCIFMIGMVACGYVSTLSIRTQQQCTLLLNTHFELSHFARRSFLGISSSFFPEFDYREAGKSFFNSKLWAKSYYLLGVFYCISIKMASNSNKSMKKDTSLTQTRTRFT